MKRRILKYGQVKKKSDNIIKYVFTKEEVKLLEMDQMTKSEFFTKPYLKMSSDFKFMILKNYFHLKYNEYVLKKFEKIPRSAEMAIKNPECSKEWCMTVYRVREIEVREQKNSG